MQTCGRQGHLFGLWKENNKVTILIDADGCPVVDLTLQIAKQFSVPVIILCDACASLLLANGVSMKQVQEWLGYGNASA